jgi:hypothetical protein
VLSEVGTQLLNIINITISLQKVNREDHSVLDWRDLWNNYVTLLYRIHVR